MHRLGFKVVILTLAAGCSEGPRPTSPGSAPNGADYALSTSATTVSVVSHLAVNRCMQTYAGRSVAGIRLVIDSCTNAASEQYVPTAAKELRVFGSMCVTVDGHGADGDPIDIENCNGSVAQQWQLTSNSQLQGLRSKCIATQDSTGKTYTRLILSTCAIKPQQQWTEQSNGSVPPPQTVASIAVTPSTSNIAPSARLQLSAVARDSSGDTLSGVTVQWQSSNAAVATVSATGLVLGVGSGTADVSATVGSIVGHATIVVAQASPGDPTDECANAAPEWIWCDDFEQDRTAQYFELDNANGSLARVAGVGRNGSTALVAHFAKGQVDAGNLKLAFGRTPSASFRPVDAGTANYREVYWRLWLKTGPGWTGGSGEKLSRAMILAGSNWSQAMIAHVWGGGAPNVDYLQLDPASGTDTAGSLRTTQYNDFANLRWLGAALTKTALFDSTRLGQWLCIEAHARLNDAGQSNGVFELWVNGNLEASRTGLNWVGAYSAYGINALFVENYWNSGSPATQERYFDNLVVSTKPIACNGIFPPGTSSPPPPPAPVATVSVSVASSSLLVGGTTQATATLRDANGNILSGRSVTWTSSSPLIAGVSAAGLVSGLLAGSATITATSEGVSGSASLTVTAPAPAPVASVAVSLASSSLLVGGSTQATATLRDASGNVLSGRTVTWVSSAPSVASVSSSGVVNALLAGSATITASSEGITGSAGLTVSAPPPPPSSSTCANEPAGLTPITDQPWNAVPPMLNSLDAYGWGVDRDPENVAIVSDPTAPRSPNNVAHGIFNAGAPGGTAPFRIERPFAGQKYTTVFECVWLMHSPNFTDGGNLGTKVSFYRGPGQNNYWAFDGGATGHDGFYFFFGIQGGGGDRSWRASWSAKPLGVWHKYEILTVSNTPGQNNGILRVWADGQLILQSTDVAFWGASQTPGWTGVAWEPVYGGGLNPVPVTMYQAIDHWYVSAK